VPKFDDEEVPVGPVKTPFIDPLPPPKGFVQIHVKYINGYPDGTVRQDNFITRAEVASILFRLLDNDKGDKNDPLPNIFPDFADDEWYAHDVNYLEKTGRVRGYPGGDFKPEAFITRAEFATIMATFIDDSSGGIERNFVDFNESHWAYQFIMDCAKIGWMIGYPDGTFMPDTSITRAEVVTTLNRIMNRKIHVEDIPSEAPTYLDLFIDHWAYADVMEASFGQELAHTYERKADMYENWILMPDME